MLAAPAAAHLLDSSRWSFIIVTAIKTLTFWRVECKSDFRLSLKNLQVISLQAFISLPSLTIIQMASNFITWKTGDIFTELRRELPSCSGALHHTPAFLPHLTSSRVSGLLHVLLALHILFLLSRMSLMPSFPLGQLLLLSIPQGPCSMSCFL